MQRKYLVEVVLDDEDCGPDEYGFSSCAEFPGDDAMRSILAHSTAAEAIAEATGARVSIGRVDDVRPYLALDRRAAEYVKTIADAAVAGTVSVEGLKVVGWLMRGWTLEAAKHQVNAAASGRK